MQSLSISQKRAALVAVTVAGIASIRWLRTRQKEMQVYKALQDLRSDLATAGMDIFHLMSIHSYNISPKVQAAPHLRILPPSPGAADVPWSTAPEQCTAILVGNTKAIWQPFLDHCRAARGSTLPEHPFDTYVEEAVLSALRACLPAAAGLPRYDVRFVTDLRPERVVSFQTMAVAGGLCVLQPEAHLCLHTTYGPWLAFRALILLDVPLSALSDLSGRSTAPLCVSVDPRALQEIKQGWAAHQAQVSECVKFAMESSANDKQDQKTAAQKSQATNKPEEEKKTDKPGCCKEPPEGQDGASGQQATATSEAKTNVQETWTRWLHVRDACCKNDWPGSKEWPKWRFPAHQLEYHYKSHGRDALLATLVLH
eukprot:g81056.t1